jgi:hypothetical protein
MGDDLSQGETLFPKAGVEVKSIIIVQILSEVLNPLVELW